jgi:hypothetical protein
MLHITPRRTNTRLSQEQTAAQEKKPRNVLFTNQGAVGLGEQVKGPKNKTEQENPVRLEMPG